MYLINARNIEHIKLSFWYFAQIDVQGFNTGRKLLRNNFMCFTCYSHADHLEVGSYLTGHPKPGEYS